MTRLKPLQKPQKPLLFGPVSRKSCFEIFEGDMRRECSGDSHVDSYGFPAFVPEGDEVVKAELIEIPIADWAAVDGLEGYPRLYDRQLYPATLADGTEVSGWVYIMNNLPDNARVIESGDWKEHRHGG